MAEININIAEIDNAVAKLRNLQLAINNAPATVGGGNTVNELEEISEVYKKIDGNFIQLVLNTASFLENVKKSYASVDEKSLQGINS